MGRGVGIILLRWVGSERMLILGTEGVGSTGRVQKLFAVAEDDEEEEDGNTDLNQEGDDVRPRGSIPGLIAPYAKESMENYSSSLKRLTI